MKSRYTFRSLALAAGVIALQTAGSAQTGANAYIQHNLVSDVPGTADVTDPNLINPWGISFSATSPFWITSNGKSNTLVYNGASSAAIAVTTTVVAIPAGSASAGAASSPTGQVQNFSTAFLLANGTKASFIFATEDGTISAWNAGTSATVMVDNSASGAVYEGLAIGTAASGPVLYAPNFNTGKIDVFDGSFKPVTLAGNFTDPGIPAGYAPFNIWPVNGQLYVMYAKQNATKKASVAAAGNGYVSIFDFNGNFVKELVANGQLNAPWGVAIAPASWGAFGGAVLVGNFGNGQINAFDAKTGAFLGTLKDQSGNVITINGLWATVFGNGGSGGDKNYLYFAAGISGEQHGLFGYIAPPAGITSVVNGASNLGGPVSPGEIVAINGISIGPRPGVSSPALAAGTVVGSTIGTTSVTVNGVGVPLLYTHADQANIIMPWGLTGANANVVVTSADGTTAAFQVPVASTSPGMFTSGATGTGAVLALNQDGTVNSATNAAAAGSVVAIYTTGLGQTTPAGADGTRNNLIISEAVAPVTASVGGQKATVIYAGSAPGQIEGVMQVELVVPSGAGTGAVPLVISAGAVSTTQTATIVLK